jgi:hypothetical protein
MTYVVSRKPSQGVHSEYFLGFQPTPGGRWGDMTKAKLFSEEQARQIIRTVKRQLASRQSISFQYRAIQL